MPSTDQLQAELTAANGIITGLGAKTATLQGQMATVQQRCSRLEQQVRDLQIQLAKVKKG